MQPETSLASLEEHGTNARYLADDRQVYYAVKRVLDVAMASCLLLLLLPLMILAAIAILIYSPGPIFFTQERVGAKRRSDGNHIYWEPTTFHCYKFRTMRLDTDSSIHRAYIKALIENDERQMQAVQEAATRPRGLVSPEQLIAAQMAPTRPRKLVDDERVIAPGRILRKL